MNKEWIDEYYKQLVTYDMTNDILKISIYISDE